MKIKDQKYNKIVSNILSDDDFNQIKKIEHHGTTRFDHSLKVSYYSYVIAKKLHLNYIATARAGLLHDYFFSKEDRNFNERLVSTFVHPKEAVNNAKRFGLSDLEENIIESHMFPIYISIPKYLESWIVTTVDKVVGLKEFLVKYSFKIVREYNVLLLLFTLIR